jgi:C-terminal processing protease CtpA/Prc
LQAARDAKAAERDAKAAERDASTISGILKEMSLTTSRVRQGTSAASAAYGRLASGSTPRRPSLTRRPSAKRVPIFSYGEIAGLSVRLPADGKTCGPKGLLVTDALRGQWAHQCGVQAGARLVSIDGTRLEGLDAAEIRLAASRASRPLWLDVQPGGHAPTGDALSGSHLLL